MNEQSLKSALRQMNVGERRSEKWFSNHGLSDEDLAEAVKAGYLTHYNKDPKDFMSNAGYELKKAGRVFAWE